MVVHSKPVAFSDIKMADDTAEENILDYEDEENETAVDAAGDQQTKKDVKGTYVSIHSSGFRDFLLKPELLRAIIDCGFEHPSEGNFLFIWYSCGQFPI